MYRSTCDYLDCDKYWYLLTSEGDGDEDFDPRREQQKGEIPLRLFVATLVGLLVFLALFYHLVWLCFARIVEDDEERAGGANIRARGFIYNGYRNGR